MSRDFEDDDHTTFFAVKRDDGDDAVLSGAAYELHTFGMMNSIKDGHPGFVSDEYLNAISAETNPRVNGAVRSRSLGPGCRRLQHHRPQDASVRHRDR